MTGAQPICDYRESNQEFAESFGRHLVARGFSQSTRKSYAETVRRFVEHCGPSSVLEVERADISAFLEKLLGKGLAATSVNQRTNGLRCFFKCLAVNGWIRRNPMVYIGTRKLPKRLPRVLTIEEVERIIAAASNPLERAVVEVLYGTACRISELCRMKVADVDLDGGSIKVLGKGNRERYVLFGSKAAEAIREYQQWRPSRSGWLFESPAREGSVHRSKRIHTIKGVRYEYRYWVASFYTTDGKQHMISLGDHRDEGSARAYWEVLKPKLRAKIPMAGGKSVGPYTLEAIRNTVYRLAERAGVKGVSCHTFRRACASHLLDRGADIRYVQEFLGHKRISTTCLYTTLSEKKLRSDYEKGFPDAEGQQRDSADED